MVTIGTQLRRARERSGLSLQQLSERTKIRAPVLQAMEHDDFSQLPGGLLSRGHLRAYAREVHLDPEAVVRRFRDEFPSELPPLADAFKDRLEARRLSTPDRTAPLLLAGLVLVLFALLQLPDRPARPDVQHGVTTTGLADESSGRSTRSIAAPATAASVAARSTGLEDACRTEPAQDERSRLTRVDVTSFHDR